MEALGGGLGGLWNLNFPFRKRPKSGSKSKSSDSAETIGRGGFHFPLKQAATAGSLALAGDTIAQLRARMRKGKALEQHSLSDSHGFTKVVEAFSFFFWGFSFVLCSVAEICGETNV